MLKLTPAAFGEVPAGRVTPGRRRFQYLMDHTTSEGFLALRDSNPETLGGRGKRDENGEPVVPSYRIAAVGEPFGRYVDDVANLDKGFIHGFTIAGEKAIQTEVCATSGNRLKPVLQIKQAHSGNVANLAQPARYEILDRLLIDSLVHFLTITAKL